MFTLKWEAFRYSRKQFGIWRIAFGLYLSFYFWRIIPYGRELFSSEGPFGDLSLIPFQTFFPKRLLLLDSVNQVHFLLITAVFCSICIAAGFFRRSAAFCLWLLVMWLYNRNPFSDSPEYGFVNWLIFALAFIPVGEAYSFSKKDENWYMPRFFYWGAWIILAVGYFYAASSKFRVHDPHWMNGTAMYYVFATDNARLQWYGDFFHSIPLQFFLPLTWGALILQSLAPVFISFRKTRPWWWLMATSVHIGLLFFVNLAQLTLGMILFHLFLFDQSWLKELRSSGKTSPVKELA